VKETKSITLEQKEDNILKKMVLEHQVSDEQAGSTPLFDRIKESTAEKAILFKDSFVSSLVPTLIIIIILFFIYFIRWKYRIWKNCYSTGNGRTL